MEFTVAHVLGAGSAFKWNLNLSWFLGIMAAVAMLLPAMSSVTAIATTLSWREWGVLQSGFGFAALVLATGHTLALVRQSLARSNNANRTLQPVAANHWCHSLQGVPTWDTALWTHNMPNVSIMSTIPGEVVILLKLASRSSDMNPCWK